MTTPSVSLSVALWDLPLNLDIPTWKLTLFLETRIIRDLGFSLK